MNNKVVYPGTFDPLTCGHVALIERAASIFTEVVVAIAPTSRKDPVFSLQERVDMASEALGDLPNVLVKSCEGLLVEFVEAENAKVIIRGLRAVSDFDYEFQLSGMNHQMAPSIETIFLPALGDHAYVSGTMVREIVRLGGDPSPFVPPAVLERLQG